MLSLLCQTLLFPIPNAIPGKLIFNSPAFLLTLNSGYYLLLFARASPYPAHVFCTQKQKFLSGFLSPPVPGSLMRPDQTKKHPRVQFGAGRKEIRGVQVGLMGSERRKHLWVCIPANETENIFQFPWGDCSVHSTGCSVQRSSKSFKTPAGIEKPA